MGALRHAAGGVVPEFSLNKSPYRRWVDWWEERTEMRARLEKLREDRSF